jgi:uncharacterized membrane protein YfcA
VPTGLLIILFFGGVIGLSVGLVGIASVLAVPLLVYGAGLEPERGLRVDVDNDFAWIHRAVQKLHSGAIRTRANTGNGVESVRASQLIRE